MTSRMAVAGALLCLCAVGAWFAFAAPAGTRASQASLQFDASMTELDARVSRAAGKELVVRATDAVQARSLVCSAYEEERVKAAASFLGDPVRGLNYEGTPISEWRRVAAVLRQDGSRIATVALKSSGGPDVPGWPLFTPSWFEPSAPDPDLATLKTDFETLRLDIRFAEDVASLGGLALAPTSIKWTLDVANRWNSATATLRAAIPTRSVPQVASKLVASMLAAGAVAEISGLSLTPPDNLRKGFGIDPPVDVTINITVRFPIAEEGAR